MRLNIQAPKQRKGEKPNGITTHVGKLTITAENDCEEVMLCVLSKQFSPLESKADKGFIEWISREVKRMDREIAKRRLSVVRKEQTP